MNQINPLIKTIYANEDNLLDQVKAQIVAGADPNERTEYFETPLRVSSYNGRFDVVKFLFESGADSSHLDWTPLFHAIAYGQRSGDGRPGTCRTHSGETRRPAASMNLPGHRSSRVMQGASRCAVCGRTAAGQCR